MPVSSFFRAQVIGSEDGVSAKRSWAGLLAGSSPARGEVAPPLRRLLGRPQLWENLGRHSFWRDARAEDAGAVPWDKVLELLVVNRLLAPRRELFVHEKWFPQSAMDVLLDTDARVADSPREIIPPPNSAGVATYLTGQGLYRCLDRLFVHKPDLFGATFDLLLSDLTSMYFEGDMDAVPKARRGYSRDHRPDCKQLVLARIVTPEGFPLTCEIVTTSSPANS